MEVRNRLKGLDLVDRVPDELWTEVCDIVEETGIKTIPMEKKHKKAQFQQACLGIPVLSLPRYVALIAEEGFLSSSCYSLELCIQIGISFLFSFAFCFSSFHSYL